MKRKFGISIVIFIVILSCNTQSSKTQNKYDLLVEEFIKSVEENQNPDQIIDAYFFEPDSISESTARYSNAAIHSLQSHLKKDAKLILYKNEDIQKHTEWRFYDPNFCECNYSLYLEEKPEFSISICYKYKKIYSIIHIGEFNPKLQIKWLR